MRINPQADTQTTILHGPSNSRRVETISKVQGGQQHLISYSNGRKEVWRPSANGNQERTVIVNGQVQSSQVYQSYTYDSVTYYRPIPSVVFAPGFYSWLSSPLRPSASGQPAGSPADEVFSDYEKQSDNPLPNSDEASVPDLNSSPAPNPTSAPESEEVHKLDEKDVHEEIERQNKEAQKDPKGTDTGYMPKGDDVPPEALQAHLFKVFAAPVEAALSEGKTCSLTGGDQLYHDLKDLLDPANPKVSDETKTLKVKVLVSHASKGKSDLCETNAIAYVSVADLQEMYNHKKEILLASEQHVAARHPAAAHHSSKSQPPTQAIEVAQGQPDDDTKRQLAILMKQFDQQSSDAQTTDSEVKTAASASM